MWTPLGQKLCFQRELAICIIPGVSNIVWHRTHDKYSVSKCCPICAVNYFVYKGSYLLMLPHTSRIIVSQFLVKVEHKIKPLSHWTKEGWNANPGMIVFGYLFTHLSINLPIECSVRQQVGAGAQRRSFSWRMKPHRQSWDPVILHHSTG